MRRKNGADVETWGAPSAMSDVTTETPDSVSFDVLVERPELCMKLARSICERHRLGSDCTRMEGASQLVFSCAGKHIVKVFSPADAEFHRAESVFLDRLYGRLPVPTPRLVAAGSWGGHPYVLMEHLEGASLGEVWDELDETDRRRLFSRLGEAVRTLHSLPPEIFDAAPFRWRPLIEQQRANVIENHRRWGLDEAWLAQIPRYLDEAALDIDDLSRVGPLHTELMPNHVLVRRSSGGWEISGLIDFEPSMVGQSEYEFCAVGLFLTPGDKGLFRHFLLSYGYRECELTEAMSRRIMALLLLHRYGNLHRFLKRAPAHERWTALEQPERHWFGL